MQQGSELVEGKTQEVTAIHGVGSHDEHPTVTMRSASGCWPIANS